MKRTARAPRPSVGAVDHVVHRHVTGLGVQLARRGQDGGAAATGVLALRSLPRGVHAAETMFPTRADSAAALMQEVFECERRVAADHAGDPNACFVLLRSIVENIGRFGALNVLVDEDAGRGSQLDRSKRELVEMFRTPRATPSAPDMVRPDLTVDDVFLGPLMIRGSVEGADAGHSTTASRALGLLLDGMAARDRDTR